MNKLVGMPCLKGLSNVEGLDLIANLIDQAIDESNHLLVDHALYLADELEARELQLSELALLNYFRANAWGCRFKQRSSDHAYVWAYEQPEIQKQVLLLRQVIYGSGFMSMPVLRRCQILTNLGNLLNTLGRFVEARAHWSGALVLDKNFWMARANRGRGLMSYADALYDKGHCRVLALMAHQDLIMAVAHIPKYPHLGDTRLAAIFSRSAVSIAQHFDVASIKKEYKPYGWPIGTKRSERLYRRWCLKNVLFLNPLNDIGDDPIAARDIMGLPSFIARINTSLTIVGMFNELKQLFVSARWMLWEGVTSPESHFSDREVQLYITHHSASYGLSLEKVKMAFRAVYSVLDKIAYFLNHYLELKIPEKQVAFRTIWYEKDKVTVRDRFAKSENWPLRGLFWLSKDLFDENLRDSTEPDARVIAEMRNHLEHKYVKILEVPVSTITVNDPFFDTVAHMVTRSDLEMRTLRLVKLVRSALIYLLLGIHREERERIKGKEGKFELVPLELWRNSMDGNP